MSQYTHVRPKIAGDDTEAKPVYSNKGGVTVAWNFNDTLGQIEYGLSVCSNKVFAYGTLRDRRKQATHSLPGYRMFNYGKFPFILPAESSCVYGSILTIDDNTLATLDYIENVRSRLYKRVQEKVVSLTKDKETRVWVYVPDLILSGDDTDYPIIKSGDWLKR